jgi:spermidine/putrescine transport system substrate-binding protein
MKSLLLGICASAILASGAARAEGELRIYNWWDYTSPKMIERFSQAYDVDVTVDEYQSNEDLLATLLAGDSGYDVVVPSDYMVQRLIEEGMLAETRPNQMANFKNVDPRWVDVFWDPGRNYSVPYLWGTTALAVDKAAFGAAADTLELLFEPPPELQGRIGVISSEIIFAASRYLGKPPCSGDPADLDALAGLLANAKRHWGTIGPDQFPGMVSGETALALVWNGMALDARRERSTWAYVYPREGFSGWMDNVVVLKGAANLENAKLLQNFVMDPEIAALNSDSFHLANGVIGSEKFLPPEFADLPEIRIPAGVEPEFPPLCPQAVRDRHDAIWAALME